MAQHYDKLIRDHIPAIIAHEGHTAIVEELSLDEYRLALRKKLVEEAREVETAEGNELLIEIADLHEVIDALLNTYGVDPGVVRAVQAQRRAERGGFTKRLRLIRVD